MYLKYSGNFKQPSTWLTTPSIVFKALVHFSFKHFNVPSALSANARITSCCFSVLDSTAQLVTWPYKESFIEF